MEGAEDQHGHTAVLSLILGRPGLDPSAHPQLPTALPVHGDSSGPETSVWDSDKCTLFQDTLPTPGSAGSSPGP